MDPLSKFFLVVVLSIAVYFFQVPAQLLPIPVFLFLAAAVLGRVRVPVIAATFSVFVLFGSLVFFFQLINHQQGTALAQVLFFKVTREGVNLGVVFLLRLATIGCAALLFIWTTNPRDFVIGLIKLGLPYRWAFAILVALRFIPLMQEEVRKVKEAHLVRGFRPGAGVRGAVQNWQRYLFPVLASALRKAETTGIAMDSRGFGLYPYRTYVDDFQWSWSGLVLLGVVVVGLSFLGYKYGVRFVQPRYTR
jgi:energy-coupling factor transport system permease protein